MGKTISFDERTTFLGDTYTRVRSVTSDNHQYFNPTTPIPAAKTGSLTTRTNNTDGTLTMDPGHGIITGQVVDIYWVGGSRVGVVVGTVSVNSVPISGGSGDNLPAQSTAINVGIRQTEVGSVVGNNAVAMLAFAALLTGDYYGYVSFLTAGDVQIAAYKLSPDRPNWDWDNQGDASNPFSGQTVAKVLFSHGNLSSRSMGAVILYN